MITEQQVVENETERNAEYLLDDYNKMTKLFSSFIKKFDKKASKMMEEHLDRVYKTERRRILVDLNHLRYGLLSLREEHRKGNANHDQILEKSGELICETFKKIESKI